MPQKVQKCLPRYINTDVVYQNMLPDEGEFIKGMGSSISPNPDDTTGTNNPIREGQNTLSLTPTRSNIEIPLKDIPEGYNKTHGSFESVVTQELYSFLYNGEGKYCIFVLNGNTGVVSKVVQDIELEFSDDQKSFMASHRVSLRPILNSDGEIIEKILLITDGQSWQKWILVNAGILTDGFNPALYPYFTPKPPHFDRQEVLEWATRPIMINPVSELIPNTNADLGKINRLIDSAFQFSVSVNYTDGRQTVLSPYSLPLIVNSYDFLNNPDNLSKNARVRIAAGGVFVESIDIYVRQCKKQDVGVASEIVWDDWKWIDRVYKFDSNPNVLETEFWLRTNPFPDNNYDPVFNTIDYIFDNSKLGLPPLIDTSLIENDLPELSVAHAQLADAEGLGNNRYGYNNLEKSILDKLSTEVKYKDENVCNIPLRTIYLYAYAGQCGTDFSYSSQVGYINGEDTQVRFGGLRVNTNADGAATINFDESKFYQLDFSNKKSFRVYLKGTPYFADGEWYIVKSDNSLTKIDNIYDFSNLDVLKNVQSIFEAGSYFICRFKLVVPAGRYIATIGRHNVASSGDYRNTSTYIYGIANSRIKSVNNNGVIFTSIKPNAIGTFSKEMEVDCTASSVDVWGNGADTFYIYSPYNAGIGGNGRFRFIEGYFQESPDSPIPVELFPYRMNHAATDDCGQFTDKNGFYWSFTKVQNANVVDIQFYPKLNCTPTDFLIPTSQSGVGWMQNAVAYLSAANAGEVGDCNRIVYTGKITSLDGLIGYSNVSISIKDGGTVFTKTDGTFTLIVHNGLLTNRVSNVYVNAGANFNITIAGCGYVPVTSFNEALAPCSNCNVRNYPVPLVMGVNAQGGSQKSLKENASYSVGIGMADLAGRLSFVNLFEVKTIPSFLQRNNTLASYIRALIGNGFTLEDDLKWATFFVSKTTSFSKYIDWVGDKIQYIDSNGNVVADPASAVLCAIYIDSLYDYNIANNFSLLSSYQFVPKDRIRILDDGDGNLLNVATYGDPIDLQVLGTNYNQAAQAAGIIPNTQNPIVNVNTNTTQLNTSVTLFVKYDSRLDKIIDSTGFWIEIYTPIQKTEFIPYFETTWYPVVNNKIAIFIGFNSAGQPNYSYPTHIDIDFWDTYLFNRNINIPDVGDKFLAHPFNSPNVSDNWGANLISGGRENTVNPNAKQLWYISDVARSNDFVSGSSINGLGLFKRTNRKDFSFNPAGGIVAMIASRNVVLFICQNDFFTTNYQFHFAYPNEQGVMVVNLDNDLSQPFQKTGQVYGCDYEDTGTIVVYDDIVAWYDKKNAAWILCDYKSAKDVSDITDKDGRKYGVKSYFIKKSNFVGAWNNTHAKVSRFDVIAGVDMILKNLMITFRPRRKNSNADTSYINQRRNWSIDYQETITYNLESGRWTRTECFTPECYGVLRGSQVGVQFYTFAAGKMFAHNDLSVKTFLNYYGLNVEPVFAALFISDPDNVMILQNVVIDGNMAWMIDMVFDEENNSYSYVPVNYFKKKEDNFYAEFLRDMTTYFAPTEDNSFRSTLICGKRIFGGYFFVRFVGNPAFKNKYRQVNQLYYEATDSPSNKK